MRAVWWTRVGPPEVLVYGEAPNPRPHRDQALIEVAVSGITFIETQLRAGRSPRATTLQPPAILGNAVGGIVAAVGKGGDPALVGQRVISGTGGSGGYAQLALASVADLIPVPDGVPLSDAVALLADGRTATGLHRLAAPKPGEIVLVEAAAGGVGSLLVQFAIAAGARVIAAASSPPKLELARALGAYATVDYTAPGWIEQLTAAAPDGLDVAYDGVGGTIGRAAFEAVRAGGRFVIHGAASGAMTDAGGGSRGVSVVGPGQLAGLGTASRQLALSALGEAAAGRLRPVVGQTFPLHHADAAHAAIEARRTLGKTLLTVE